MQCIIFVYLSIFFNFFAPMDSLSLILYKNDVLDNIIALRE